MWGEKNDTFENSSFMFLYLAKYFCRFYIFVSLGNLFPLKSLKAKVPPPFCCNPRLGSIYVKPLLKPPKNLGSSSNRQVVNGFPLFNAYWMHYQNFSVLYGTYMVRKGQSFGFGREAEGDILGENRRLSSNSAVLYYRGKLPKVRHLHILTHF